MSLSILHGCASQDLNNIGNMSQRSIKKVKLPKCMLPRDGMASHEAQKF